MAAFSVATFIICSADAARAWTGSAQFFGAALNAGTDSKQTYHSGGGVPFATYFNQFTEDASMGWDQLQPNANDFNGGTLARSVADYNYAKSHGFPYCWNSTLYRQSNLPSWFPGLSPSAALRAWENLLAGIASNMPNIDQIEVFNEPIHEGRNVPANIYNALGGAGATGWDWLIQAFRIVRSYFPNASLGVNEWGAELTGSSIHSSYVSLLQTLKNAGVLQWFGLENYWGSNYPDNPLSTSAATLQAGLNDY
ncbi:MAG: endo-1,4-beta-xylanase, partial [Verrucomicrobia bacterium]|nr:endo-1,4-beta-xylanase [Verrucomicrobiota bacterium]